MFASSPRGIPPRQAIVKARDAQPQSSEVPLWAFVVMTVFALFLMAFVCLLLWRPGIFRYIQQPIRDVNSDEKLENGSGNVPCQCSRGHSLRRPWGGSFRSNINRWRNAVDGRGEGPPPNAPTEVYDDEPTSHNYAPSPARPLSYMQRIPEGYEQYDQQAQYGIIKPANTAQQRIQ